MTSSAYDLIIIGGGPSGINIGISAAKAGLKYLIIEKGMLVNSVYHFPANMTFFSTSLKLEIGEVPFISHADKPSRREALEYYRRLVAHFHLSIHLYETVEAMEALGGQTGYRIQTNKGSYTTAKVVVATGFYDTPRLMEVPGEDLPKVKHYYDDAHVYLGQKVLVVGAANSACDAALECWQKGADVTMAIRGGSIYEKVKYWIRPNIENRIQEGSIKAYFHTQVTAIETDKVRLQTPDGPLEIANDWVLAMTGYQPNYDLLRRLGLQIDSEHEACLPVYDEDTLETSLPGVYMAGVVCAGMKTNRLFIENTRNHGDIIVGQITGQLNTAL